MIFVIAVILAVFVVPAPWGLVLVGVAAVIEIGETFFWIWLSQRHRVKMGAETMLGARAEVASHAGRKGRCASRESSGARAARPGRTRGPGAGRRARRLDPARRARVGA